MDAKTLQAEIVLLLTEAAQKERRVPRYGFSDAAGCAREHVYTFREYESSGALALVPTPLAWAYQMDCGSAVGARLEAAARRLGWETQVHVKWETDGLLIEGDADIVGPDFVLDGKYVRAGTYGMVRHAAKWEHRVQTHGYAHALGKPWVGVVYQKFTEKGEVVPFVSHVEETDPAIARQVVEHWKAVDTARSLGFVPPRAFAADSFECKTCPYKTECWKEAA